jgi:hypothetical protein
MIRLIDTLNEEINNKQSFSQSNRLEEKGNKLRKNFRDKVGKKVLQIDAKTFTPLTIFQSVIEASEKTGVHKSNIIHCLHKDQKTAGGFIWIYKHPENPYFEYIINENEVIRVFECDDDLGIEELWHQDNEDRIIEIIGETDWQIQLDNQLPTSMNVPIFIPKHMWHRAIKGTGNLQLKIHRS